MEQKIIIGGEVRQKPKETNDGCTFFVGTHRRKADGQVETTPFRVSVQGQMAQKMLQSIPDIDGSLVSVEGSLIQQPVAWLDKDKQPTSIFDVTAFRIYYLGPFFEKAETFHEIILAGRLGKEPELRYLPDGSPVCNFSLAADGFNGGQQITTWFNVGVHGKQAEACNKYLAKGRQVLLNGSLETKPDAWISKSDGQSKAGYAVRTYRATFSGGGSNGSRQDQGETGVASSWDYFFPQNEMTEDEIPF